MQTSRFQLGLIATLAVGLGFSLASSEAVGYPSGAAVSMGASPVWSVGGQTPPGVSYDLFTAPGDQDVIVTDISLTAGCGGTCVTQVTIDTPTDRLASYRVRVNSAGYYGPVHDSLQSGLRVPAGQVLSITTSTEYVDYTLSGYYAQP
jgi:hypothetical protein